MSAWLSVWGCLLDWRLGSDWFLDGLLDTFAGSPLIAPACAPVRASACAPVVAPLLAPLLAPVLVPVLVPVREPVNIIFVCLFSTWVVGSKLWRLLAGLLPSSLSTKEPLLVAFWEWLPCTVCRFDLGFDLSLGLKRALGW